jgi:hypothetical protein
MTEITSVVEETLAHHPYGPSKLENYDPRSGGCEMFEPNPESGEKAEFGSLKHTAVSIRDLSVLGGDTYAENEVSRVVEFMESTRAEYPIVHSELMLKTEKIFGTLDHLGLSEDQAKGIIIDAKFGAWSVTPARSNLQGWAYVILAFANFPQLRKIKVVFYAAKTGSHTEHTFWRYRLPSLEKRIYGIIERAQNARLAPTLKNYSPNAVNCSYCVRLNCPARLALMGTLVTQWTGQPVELPRLNLLEITTPQLSALKKLGNVFKAFSTAVDAEAKRRAFDENDIVEGYEIAEKSGPRTVVGANSITEASKVLAQIWDEHEFGPQDWGNFFLENVELSIADLENEIARLSPVRRKTVTKKIIVDALEKAGLVNASRIFYLSAIKE